jgi:LPXTG-motif cell wall-anchored protein
VTGTTHDGRPVDTSGVVLTSSVATDAVDGLTVTFPTASPHVITATLGDVSTSVTVHVTPTPAPKPGPAGLSTTGTDLLPPLAAGLLLLLAGAGLVWRRRRLSR